jgi:hypothetical protein
LADTEPPLALPTHAFQFVRPFVEGQLLEIAGPPEMVAMTVPPLERAMTTVPTPLKGTEP